MEVRSSDSKADRWDGSVSGRVDVTQRDREGTWVLACRTLAITKLAAERREANDDNGKSIAWQSGRRMSVHGLSRMPATWGAECNVGDSRRGGRLKAAAKQDHEEERVTCQDDVVDVRGEWYRAKMDEVTLIGRRVGTKECVICGSRAGMGESFGSE